MTDYYLLHTTQYLLLTAYCLLHCQAVDCEVDTDYLLVTTYYLLLTTYYALLTAYYLLRITRCLLLTTYKTARRWTAKW